MSPIPRPIAVALCLGPLLAACSDPAARAAEGGLTGKLVLTGSSTCAPLLSEIGRRFEELHPGVRVDVQTGGSSRGIADIQSGLADIGMSSRALAPEEREGRLAHLIAQDGVAFIVHRSNPVSALDDDQLRDIYTGRIRRWSEVGGRDEPITVISRADGRSEVSLVSEYLGIDAADFVPDVIAGENQQGIKQVAGDPDAICYMSLGSSEFEARRGTPIALLALRGVPATSRAVADGAYPLARPLILLTRPDSPPLVNAFVDFARSPAVHDLVEEHAFIPVER